jgi:hypothetical protein
MKDKAAKVGISQPDGQFASLTREVWLPDDPPWLRIRPEGRKSR